MTDVVVRMHGPIALASDAASTITVSGGGSAANVAAWAASLGRSTALIARVGDDIYGREARSDLEARGVDARLIVDPTRATGTCVVLVTRGGERTMLPDAGANAVWPMSEVPREPIDAARHLHVVGYALLREGARAAALQAMQSAWRRGVTVSVDPSSAAPLEQVGPDTFLGWTRGADVILANREEATVLTRRADPLDAATALTEFYAEAVVKAGVDGAVWAGRGVVPVRVAAERVTVVDSTGAGDAFAAAYLHARLGGSGPRDALGAANRTAARAVARVGARPG